MTGMLPLVQVAAQGEREGKRKNNGSGGDLLADCEICSNMTQRMFRYNVILKHGNISLSYLHLVAQKMSFLAIATSTTRLGAGKSFAQ